MGKSAKDGSKWNLTFAGESGKVFNLKLDDTLSIQDAVKQTLVDFGSEVNVLEWSPNGAFLIVAGLNKKVLIIDSATESSTESTGIEIDSEVVSASVDSNNENFSLSLKDGSVVLGKISTAKLFKKI